eukprot:553839-Hanusia_phi.AAC.1
MSVKVKEQVGTLSQGFSYDGPTVFRTIPSLADTAGNAIIFVEGLNFGWPIANIQVWIGSWACANVQFIRQDLLSCTAPAGFGRDLPVRVRTGGQETSTAKLFSYIPPTLSGVLSNSGPSSGGGIVTFFGKYFGYEDSSPRSYFGGTLCAASMWTSDSAVTCVLSGGYGSFLSLSLDVQTQRTASQLVASGYVGPTISTGTRQNQPATGSILLSIIGRDMSVASYTPGSRITGTSCLETRWSSDTCIASRSARSGPMSSKSVLVVSVGNVLSSLTESVSFSKPDLYIVPGAVRNLFAQSLSLNVSSLSTMDCSFQARMGATSSHFSQWTSDSSLLTKFQTSSGSTKSFALTVGFQSETASRVLSYDMLSLTSSSRCNQLAHGKAILSVKQLVTSLHLSDITSTLRAGVTSAEATNWISFSAISCVFPTLSSNSRRIVLSLSQLVHTSTEMTSFDSCKVSTSSRTNIAPGSSETLVFINGINLGAFDSTVSILMGNSRTPLSIWSSDTEVVCKAAAFIHYTMRLICSVNTFHGSISQMFSSDSPLLSQVSTNSPLAFSTSIAIQLSTSRIRISGTSSQCTTWTSQCALVCNVIPFVVHTSQLTLTYGIVPSSLTDAFSFSEPTLSSTSPTNLLSRMGPASSLTLLGLFNSRHDHSLASRILETVSPSTNWLSSTAVKSKIAVSTRHTFSSILTVSLLLGSTSEVISYDRPILSSIGTVNLQSQQFKAQLWFAWQSYPHYTEMLRISKTSCESSFWSSVTSLQCRIPATSSKTLQLALTALTTPGTLSQCATYDALLIDQLISNNFPATGSTRILLLAAGLGP